MWKIPDIFRSIYIWDISPEASPATASVAKSQYRVLFTSGIAVWDETSCKKHVIHIHHKKKKKI